MPRRRWNFYVPHRATGWRPSGATVRASTVSASTTSGGCVLRGQTTARLTWDDGGPLSVAATTVYRLASEQAGDTARSFDAWMMQHGFSASKAADVLGMSRRNIINYRTATRPIPKVVRLACKAVDLVGDDGLGR